MLIAIVDGSDGLAMSFMNGVDLSGTAHGAGGSGGLLAITFKTNGTYFAASDGNGNVASLVSAADGTESGHYEYDPFGQTVRVTGLIGKKNPLRFGGQFTDEVTDEVKYLYREYAATRGAWTSRDSINEIGDQLVTAGLMAFNRDEEKNLYTFIHNNPVSGIDLNGHLPWNPFTCCCHGSKISQTPIETGVEIVRWHQSNGLNYHVWLTWDGNSVDSNSGSWIDLNNTLGRKPAGATTIFESLYSHPTPVSTPVKLSPCKYDFNKLRAALTSETDQYKTPTRTRKQCDVFVNDLLDECEGKSKGCTVPAGVWPPC